MPVACLYANGRLLIPQRRVLFTRDIVVSSVQASMENPNQAEFEETNASCQMQQFSFLLGKIRRKFGLGREPDWIAIRVTVAQLGTDRHAEAYVVVTSKSRKLSERKRIQ